MIKSQLKESEEKIKACLLEKEDQNDNFQRERDHLLEMASKFKSKLKKYEEVRQYLSGPSSSGIKELISKIETLKSNISDLEERIVNKDQELARFKEFYQKSTFFNHKKKIESGRQKSREKNFSPVLGVLIRRKENTCSKL